MFVFTVFLRVLPFDFETRIMSTCMSTSRSNYFDMSIWKNHADHSTSYNYSHYAFHFLPLAPPKYTVEPSLALMTTLCAPLNYKDEINVGMIITLKE